MADILHKIVEVKRGEVGKLPRGKISARTMAEARARRGAVRDFARALREPRTHPGLIAEIKKASPSAGVIRADFDPVQLARAYARGSATCLSVLTDQQFFQGSLDDLRKVREAVDLPLLRKDFIIDERQILESVNAGADAILLITAILTDQELVLFQELAGAASLACLVEVHDEDELKRALKSGARMIGINNRDLKTFTVDISVTEKLMNRLSSSAETGPLMVSESGVHTAEHVQRLAACGVNALLVGESLMREDDIEKKMSELLKSSAPVRIRA